MTEEVDHLTHIALHYHDFDCKDCRREIRKKIQDDFNKKMERSRNQNMAFVFSGERQ